MGAGLLALTCVGQAELAAWRAAAAAARMSGGAAWQGESSGIGAPGGHTSAAMLGPLHCSVQAAAGGLAAACGVWRTAAPAGGDTTAAGAAAAWYALVA
uniref:Uncharacterized protein n=1 Tax=Tetradesmus obliquus TaxID=3088 RepID=A0A383VZS5_TETOB|eukprot:jgi/Sobl393_1/12132/SZX70955.1